MAERGRPRKTAESKAVEQLRDLKPFEAAS